MNTPQPLQFGDEIRVIAPSQSMPSGARKQARYDRAEERIQALGYKLSYGKHVRNVEHFGTALAQERAADFTEAFKDSSVKAVFASGGGWSANEILDYVDWDAVRANPKPLIGFSDITALHNALYAKTGCTTYLGPNLGTIGKSNHWEYSLDSLESVLRHGEQTYRKSKQYMAGHPGVVASTPAWKVLQHGEAEAVAIGGNLGTFYLLQGTEYQPKFDAPYILIAEDDAQSGKYTPHEFARRLESILQLPGARKNIRGLLIGRFEPDAKMNMPILMRIIAAKNLPNIPIIANLDFGHTLPMFTIPIGGTLKISTKPKIQITITKY